MLHIWQFHGGICRIYWVCCCSCYNYSQATDKWLRLEHVQAGLSSKAPVPEFPKVLTVCKFPVKGRMTMVDQSRSWSYNCIWWWAIKGWNGDPLLLAVHHGPMDRTLVAIIAKYLQTSSGLIINQILLICNIRMWHCLVNTFVSVTWIWSPMLTMKVFGIGWMATHFPSLSTCKPGTSSWRRIVRALGSAWPGKPNVSSGWGQGG